MSRICVNKERINDQEKATVDLDRKLLNIINNNENIHA